MYFILFLVTIIGIITIAVAITITIAITVAIATALGGCGIEDDGQGLESLFLIHRLEFVEHRTLKHSSTNNEEGAIGRLLDNLGIYNDINRRTVDEDIFIEWAELLYKFGELVVLK